MFLRKVLLLIFVLLLNSAIFAAESPFQFVRYNSSARASALAGCFVSMPNDQSAVFYNPAVIPTVKDKNFSLTFMKHVLDINSGNISYSTKYQDYGWLGASLGFTNYGSFERADNSGQILGNYAANDIIFQLNYANILDSNLYYGVSAKFLYANIEKYYSTAFAIDAGIFYTLADKRTNIGLSLLHAGTQLTKYNNTSETVPLDIRLGINNRLKGLPLLVNFSFNHLADYKEKFFERFLSFSLAGEFYLGSYVQARIGYDNLTRREVSLESDKKLSGISGGIGLKLKDFNLDYALSVLSSSAMLHRISIAMSF